MAGYIGTKAVLLSTTAATVTGDMTVGGAATISGAFTSLGIDDNAAATAMTLDASGNVGIGTAAPVEKMHISGSGTQRLRITETTGGAYTQLVQSSGNTGLVAASDAGSNFMNFTTTNAGVSAERLRIDSSGNVGIGTATPLSNLHIEDLGNTVSQRIFTSDNVINTKASLLFGTTPGARTKAGVEMINTSTGNAAGTLAFSTNNGTTLTERMRIDASGNVGIGTTAPTASLEVSGTILGNTIQGNLMSSHRGFASFGTGNSAQVTVSATSEGRVYVVHAMRTAGSSNVSNAMSTIAYAGAVRTVVAINAGAGISITESAGVVSATNTSTAATMYIAVTRVS